MEEGQLQSDTQQPPQEEAPQKGDQSSAQAPLQTSTSAKALSSSLDEEETPTNLQEKGNSASQAKPLWKPIPPLLPETHTETRDQSCQTEEQLQQTSTGSHGHNTGGESFLPSSCCFDSSTQKQFYICQHLVKLPSSDFFWKW